MLFNLTLSGRNMVGINHQYHRHTQYQIKVNHLTQDTGVSHVFIFRSENYAFVLLFLIELLMLNKNALGILLSEIKLT